MSRTACFSGPARRIAVAVLTILLFALAGCGDLSKDTDASAPTETYLTIEQNEDLPLCWQEAVSAGADAIRMASEAAGADKSAFLFYTDSHWNHNARISPRLLKEIIRQTPVNKVFFGGDIVNDEPSPETVSDRRIMEYLWNWRSEIRDLRHYSVVGNHDDGNTTDGLFSYEYVYSFLFAPEESNEIVRGGYTYYYFDENSEKTRYLCLDTAYDDVNNMSSEQLSFIAESLKSTPEGWHIVVVAHLWYEIDRSYKGDDAVPVQGLSGRVAPLIDMLDRYNRRAGEFKSCGAKIEFCIGGHIHRDYVGSTPGGIPIILCETDSIRTRSAIECVEGTVTEAAVSGIVADYTKNVVSVVRVGRGSSFEVALPPDEETGPGEITYTNILDAAGYSEGLRLRSSAGTEIINANSDITGFIPVGRGDIVRLKNIQMPDSVDNYGALIVYYASDHSFISGHFVSSAVVEIPTVYDQNGNLIQFTVTADAAFVRICARRIDDTSVITVNEAIDPEPADLLPAE